MRLHQNTNNTAVRSNTYQGTFLVTEPTCFDISGRALTPHHSCQRFLTDNPLRSRLSSLWVGLKILVLYTVVASTMDAFAVEKTPVSSVAPGHLTDQDVLGMRCDFDGNGQCNLQDLDRMYQQGNLVVGVSVVTDNPFDLNGDLTINNRDLDIWLVESAHNNSYTSPYRRGDTDDLRRPGAWRDVDITDFSQLAENFDPSGARAMQNTWNNANFDGDFDVDITDFGYLASNFSPNGYGNIPEPATGALVILALGSMVLFLPYNRCFWPARSMESIY